MSSDGSDLQALSRFVISNYLGEGSFCCVVFHCQECEQELDAPARLGGGVVNCPSCDSDVAIPEIGVRDVEGDEQSPGVASVLHFLASADESELSDNGMQSGGPEARYRIREELGRGGMGSVSKAEDLNVRREVAMKRLSATSAGRPGAVARFIEEAQITGQLEHPGIAPVYELGINGDGQVFYTMKRIRGESLGEVLRRLAHGEGQAREDWPLARLLRVFVGICETVAYAHSRGVVHRDLKPDNIMLGEFGEVVVVDWGVAKIMGKTHSSERSAVPYVTSVRQDDGSEHLVTLSGRIVGTPQYMAPEQASGDVAGTNERSDVFGLGAILIEMLDLRTPYPGGQSVEHLLAAVRAGEIRIPSVSDRTPDALQAVAERATRRNPGDRYTSVGEFKHDVEAFLNGFATAAERAGFFRQARLFIRRHQAACAIAFVGIVAILIGAGISVLVNRAARLEAETNLQRYTDEQARRQTDRKQSVPALLATARDLMRAEEWEDARRMADIAQDFASDDAEVILMQGMLDFQKGHFSRTETWLQKYDGVESQSARQLAAICGSLESLPRVDWPLNEISASLNRLAYPELAVGLLTAREDRLAAWQQILRDAYGARGYKLRFLEDGRLEFRTELKGGPTDLGALVGIPLDVIHVGSAVKDLGVLARIPTLSELSCTKVAAFSDLTALRSLPLHTLDLDQIRIPLDFSVLGGMESLRRLAISSDNDSVLRSFSGLQLERLHLFGDAKNRDLEPLIGMPLRSLLIRPSGFQVAALGAIKELPLENLEIHLPSDCSDLDFLPVSTLKKLTVIGSSVENLDALSNSVVEELELMNPTSLGDLSGLSGTSVRRLFYSGRSCDPVGPVTLLGNLPAVESLHLIKCQPTFFPEPRDLPKLREIVTEWDLHLISGVLLAAVAREDWMVADAEIERMREICQRNSAWSPLLPEVDKAAAALERYRGKRSGYLAGYLRATGSFDGRTFAWVNLRYNRSGVRRMISEMGARLAVIENAELQEWLLNGLLLPAQAPGAKSDEIWLGANRGADGNYRWNNGRALTFTNWDHEEPNNKGGNESCLSMIFRNYGRDVRNGRWDDVAPDSQLTMLIEWDDP